MKTTNEKVLVYKNEDQINRRILSAKQGLIPIQVFLDEAKEAGIPISTDNLSEALHDPERFAKRYFESIAPETPALPGGFKESRRSFLDRIEWPSTSRFCHSANEGLKRTERIAAPLDAYVISDYDVTISETWLHSVEIESSVFAVTEKEKELHEAYQGMIDSITKFNEFTRKETGLNRAIDPNGTQGGTLRDYVGFDKNGGLAISLGPWIDLVKRLKS
ncbi:MAG: hypothetical protein IPP86_00230 [Bacteroidetes bacterium]|nr:hypothetical protein [Bacteroidota bacterium]